MAPAERSNGNACTDLYGPALRTFFQIADVWSLTDTEQMQLLGLHSRTSLCSWRSGDLSGAGQDTVERISYVLGIFKAINILMPGPARAAAWMRRPKYDTLFGGQSALERMTNGGVDDLRFVRRYLDAQRG